jgi:hypothetical protein
MIDVHCEELVPFQQAPRSIPTRPNLSTLHRWRQRGIRGVTLETILIGGERYTSREALHRFFERSTAAADGIEAPSHPTAARSRQQAEARRELQAAGIVD